MTLFILIFSFIHFGFARTTSVEMNAVTLGGNSNSYIKGGEVSMGLPFDPSYSIGLLVQESHVSGGSVNGDIFAADNWKMSGVRSDSSMKGIKVIKYLSGDFKESSALVGISYSEISSNLKFAAKLYDDEDEGGGLLESYYFAGKTNNRSTGLTIGYQWFTTDNIYIKVSLTKLLINSSKIKVNNTKGNTYSEVNEPVANKSLDDLLTQVNFSLGMQF